MTLSTSEDEANGIVISTWKDEIVISPGRKVGVLKGELGPIGKAVLGEVGVGRLLNKWFG